MLQAPDIGPEITTIVEQSSGSTIISLGILGRVLRGIGSVKALITNKTSETRIQNLRFFGIEVLDLLDSPLRVRSAELTTMT